jgi:flagella basal body P-ring formation protein FlgA
MLIAGLGRFVLCLIAGLVSFQVPVAAAEGMLLPVPNVTIYPGDIVRESWLVDRDFSASAFPPRGGVIDSRNALIGKIAKRAFRSRPTRWASPGSSAMAKKFGSFIARVA